MNLNEQQYASNLNSTRNMLIGAKNGAGLLSTGVTAAGGPVGVAVKAKKILSTIAHLHEKIEWSTDGLILIPFGFACIKDMLDWIGFSFPGINEALNFSIMGYSAIVLIFISSSLSKIRRAKVGLKMALKWIVMFAGTTAEEFFGLNLLPIESFTIIIAFFLVLMERTGNETPAEKTQ